MNIRCNLFGHKMRTVDGDSIAGPRQCIRENCDHTESGVEWPTWNPVPPPPQVTSNEPVVECNKTGIHVREKNGIYHVYDGIRFIGALNMIPPQASDDCCREFLKGTIHQCGCKDCLPNKWQPVDQHDTIGWCWIKYKGKVRHAWYKGDGWFMFSEHGMTGCYMTECISGVIAIEVPSL